MELPQTPDEEQEEEDDWLEAVQDVCPGSARLPVVLDNVVSRGNPAHRVVMHIDMDCFYAQVEMIRNPELRGKPLGILQKFVVVTCNYEARKFGIKKLMYVREAKEKCPQLVLVCGEDLTNYREISYKVTELLEEFSPLVERLGFDENFVDLTEMVEKRLKQPHNAGYSVAVAGHVYNYQTVNLNDDVHIQLAIGSQIAAEIREALYSRLGLTGCAGVASNKLLAKLVSGTFKPNQQTVLLPESCQHIMDSLEQLSKVPGIGYKTTERLKSLGLSSVRDLQTCSLAILEKELGTTAAQRIRMLSYGEDNSPITPSGPPQSLSDEDSFKKCSTEAEVKKKIEELLIPLLERICKDGRKPHTIRLTIRQFSPTNKWFNRESRQSPIPSHLIQKLGARNSNIIAPLVELLMKLFHKMINVKVPFHLTLLSVCFCNMKAASSITKGSIGFYLTQKKTIGPDTDQCNQENLIAAIEDLSQTKDECLYLIPGAIAHTREPEMKGSHIPDDTEMKGIHEFPFQQLPVGIDWEVFSQLPGDIKKEILSNTSERGNSTGSTFSQTSPLSKGMQSFFAHQKKEITSSYSRIDDHNRDSVACSKNSQINSPEESPELLPRPSHITCTQEDQLGLETVLLDECMSQTSQTLHSASVQPVNINLQSQLLLKTAPFTVDHMQPRDAGSEFDPLVNPLEIKLGEGTTFPSNVDLKIFSELPSEVQNELIAEWKRQELTSKIPVNKHEKKMKVTKGKKKSIPRSPLSNSLLKYFKPN